MSFTVLWDNDGVLVDTESLYFQSNREILSKIGVTLTREFFIHQSLTRGESVFELAKGLSEAERIELGQERDWRYSELLQGADTVMPGVREVLDELKGVVRMGVVTGSRRDHFDIIHRDSGLLPYFEFVLTREDYRRGKPHPDAYESAMRYSRTTPIHCVVIEDSVRGAASAIAAGLRCIVVPNELTRQASFKGAYQVLDSIRLVTSTVRNLAGAWPREPG